MDDSGESSLLFSLESLLETERERVQRVQREAQRRRDDALRRTAQAVTRRQAAAASEREARARALATEQQREQLARERGEALKLAAIEQARLEVDSRSRLLQGEQEREHLLRLAKLREDERATQYRAVAWLASGAFVLLLGSSAFGYFGQLLPEQVRQRSRYEARLATERERAGVLDNQLRLERGRGDTLATELEALKRAPPAAAPSLTTPPPGKRPPRDSRGGGQPPRPSPCRDDGDPLNPSLQPCGAR